LGAVHFSLDPALIQALRRHLPLRNFVETGTFEAQTTTTVAPLFDRVVTVELSPTLYRRALQRCAEFSQVEVIQGASPDVLRSRASEWSATSTLYWLDAHWCGGVTGGVADECPVLAELEAIHNLNDQSVVLIDDARFFLSPPPPPHNPAHWPRLLELTAALRRLSSTHALWVINDVLIYAPAAIASDLADYTRDHGVDLASLCGAAARPFASMRSAVNRLLNRIGRGAANSAGPSSGRRSGAGLHELKNGFNSALLNEHRSERIFAFHAKRLGITRLLDIGSNTGQFAAKMRALGFDGVIYSVEPQADAYKELRLNAREDVRWIPLPRQAAGREQSRLELNIADNSWSSSFLPVHQNHLRAAPDTRTVRREAVMVTKTAELLHAPLVPLIDAVKIDVQGYEQAVLDGFESRLTGVRLLLLEMSLVECYVGAPDLFTLDQFLVKNLGFTRIALEPSYYDDSTGTVQQFDGIYARVPAEAASNPGSLAPPPIDAVVTSIYGISSRTAANGVEVGHDWQERCISSWSRFAGKIVSVSDADPADPRVQWVRTSERPAIADLFAAMARGDATHMLLCNADICLLPAKLAELWNKLDPGAVYLAHRLEVELNPAAPDAMSYKSIHQWGYDLFILPADFVRFVNETRAFPPEFHIGEPWWDYLLPLIALAAGFPVKCLPRTEAVAHHHVHPTHYDPRVWLQHGELFLATLAQLASRPDCRARAILEEIAAITGTAKVRLNAVSGLICSTLD